MSCMTSEHSTVDRRNKLRVDLNWEKKTRRRREKNESKWDKQILTWIDNEGKHKRKCWMFSLSSIVSIQTCKSSEARYTTANNTWWSTHSHAKGSPKCENKTSHHRQPQWLGNRPPPWSTKDYKNLSLKSILGKNAHNTGTIYSDHIYSNYIYFLQDPFVLFLILFPMPFPFPIYCLWNLYRLA